MRQLTKQRKITPADLDGDPAASRLQQSLPWIKSNGYLWDSALPQPLPEDEGLQDSLLFLQELIEENGHTTLEQIWAYFLDERRQALVFVTEMMDRWTGNGSTKRTDTFVDFFGPGSAFSAAPQGFTRRPGPALFLNGGLPRFSPFTVPTSGHRSPTIGSSPNKNGRTRCTRSSIIANSGS